MTSGITSALVGKITANETAIGDANSGLTKAVADNTSAISTINSSAAMTSGITSALVGKITANETAIGDANSGLTKSVADLGTNKQDKLSIPASCGESGRCVLTSDTSGNLEWVDITSPLNAQQ